MSKAAKKSYKHMDRTSAQQAEYLDRKRDQQKKQRKFAKARPGAARGGYR